ncbi:hypothetical protein [Breoghania sp.]|uniref:hypothetical protein n=1 Tax=Breoghania sp. TaxID=2065378 RepID=UPI003204CDAC
MFASFLSPPYITGVRATALEPGEIVTAIFVREREGRCSAFLKLGARRYLVISIAMVAVSLDLDADGLIADPAIAVGACSAVATRLPEFVGLRPDTAALKTTLSEGALAPLTPIDDVRARAAYRRHAARELICRTIVAAAKGGA